jgi:hypothetical protein
MLIGLKSKIVIDMKRIEIIGGGTIFHVRNHLALTAPAYGSTARTLFKLCDLSDYDVNLHLTKMANGGKGSLETNEDVSELVDKMVANPDTRIIFFNPALVDYEGNITTESAAGYDWNDSVPTSSGKYEVRLKTSEGIQKMLLTPAPKILSKIRKERKDIFLVAFKTTCGATEDEQFLTGLNLLKSNSCNLVLANDTKTRVNMIITPEQARYCVTTDRAKVLQELVEITLARANGTFTRSEVVPGSDIEWDSSLVPSTLRDVVNHCIKAGAYKPFNGSTVGHFAFKKNCNVFVTSKRKTNFNNLTEVGMVLCESMDTNSVIAFGSKPSVGGQSQRIIFEDHPDADCIVHFHCPLKPEAIFSIPAREQRLFECGSHQCGKNTSNGLVETVPGIKCVYLDNHGPNIVFNKDIDPNMVIDFIDKNFDLSQSTDGVKRD